MIGRFTQRGIYRELFLTRDFLIVFIAGVVAVSTLFLEFLSSFTISTVLIISIIVNGGPIIVGSIKGILKKRINVDELVTIALIAAVVKGDFFEAATVALVMRVGELIEEAVSSGARKDIATLISFLPEKARVVDDAGEEYLVDVDDIKSGNLVSLLPGEQIPVDGVVEDGESSVNESCMTGESLPILKSSGNRVLAGSINGDGKLTVRATECGNDTRMGKVIKAVEEAEETKPEATRLVDRFAKWFTPVILSAALLTYILTWDADRAITVLIVGCPCALVLIAPLGSLASAGRAASQGTLLKGSRLIEKCMEADTLYFDKTGTLTVGTPQVIEVHPFGGASEEELLRLAYALEVSANHPFANGIKKYIEEDDRKDFLTGAKAVDVANLPGVGISGRVDDREVRLTREEEGDYVNMELHDIFERINGNGVSPVFLRVEGVIWGVIIMGDTLRDESQYVISWFRKRGIGKIGLLSGDHHGAVADVAEKVGLDPVHARMSPQEKAEHIASGVADKTVFIGDGLNDAVALVSSGVGIAMDNGEGLEAALESADAVMIGGTLWKAPFLFRLSRRTVSLMKFNIFFAFSFNVLAVILGSLGTITPILGAILHNIGAVTVALSFAVGMKDIKVKELTQ